jgi:hypothetical protein
MKTKRPASTATVEMSSGLTGIGAAAAALTTSNASAMSADGDGSYKATATAPGNTHALGKTSNGAGSQTWEALRRWPAHQSPRRAQWC